MSQKNFPTTLAIDQAPPRVARNIDALATWLGRAWDHVVTLTFQTNRSGEAAARYFEQTFIRHLERAANQRVDYAGTVEGPGRSERVHIHAVPAGTDNIGVATIEDRWRAGHAHVRVFDPTRGGVRYTIKSYGEDTPLLLRDRRKRRNDRHSNKRARCIP